MSLSIEQKRAIDVPGIEKELAELWRHEDNAGEAVIRAALWNVVAHTDNDADMTQATEVLGRASALVPQRTIIIRANPADESDLSSWISANCHLLGEGKQVCSEQISLTAGGDRVGDVPSVVNALLIPDMPVAAWWIGDLPAEGAEYIGTLLEAADRIIVDSTHFDGPDDLALLAKIATTTATLPADLNWLRLEEWRIATATMFDPPVMRAKLRHMREVRLSCCGSDTPFFGDIAGCLYYTSWLVTQARFDVDEEGHVSMDGRSVKLSVERRTGKTKGLAAVEIEFDDGCIVRVHSDPEAAALRAEVSGVEQTVSTVTRLIPQSAAELVIEELSHMHEDRLFPIVLVAATRLEKQWR